MLSPSLLEVAIEKLLDISLGHNGHQRGAGAKGGTPWGSLMRTTK